MASAVRGFFRGENEMWILIVVIFLTVLYNMYRYTFGRDEKRSAKDEDFPPYKGYEMHIITKGSVKVQTDRLERLPIKNYFKDHYIVKYKIKSDYEEILKSCKLEADQCFMIGNSPKGDINEAKLAGLNTIFIPNEQTWSPEDEAISEALPKTFELDNILGMKTIL